MNLTTETLSLDCPCGCKETEERNVYKDDIAGTPTEVEYSLHCKSCGMYPIRFAKVESLMYNILFWQLV